MKTLAALIALTIPANAGGIDLLPHYANDPPKVERVSHPPAAKAKAKPKRVKAVKRKAAPPSAPPSARAPVAATDDVIRCLAPVRVVGSQDVRESAAEDSAKKACAENVRWQHGESFQDIANARDYQRRCARSSIGEALGQYCSRCEIVATPCRPAMTKGNTP